MKVRLGTISTLAARGDKERNLATAVRLVARCAAEGAELVTMPEGFLEGYVVNEPGMTRERFMALAEPIDGPYVTRFRDLARQRRVWLLACFAEREEDRAYNTALLLDAGGEIVGRYRKTHTQSGGDPRYYSPGEALPVFDTPWGTTGVMICYDRQFPEVARTLTLQGARLILNPSWGMFNELNETMMRTRAYENGVFIAFVHVRGTLILNPRGRVVARTAPDQETLVETIDLAEAGVVRQNERGHLTAHLRPHLYTRIDSAER